MVSVILENPTTLKLQQRKISVSVLPLLIWPFCLSFSTSISSCIQLHNTFLNFARRILVTLSHKKIIAQRNRLGLHSSCYNIINLYYHIQSAHLSSCLRCLPTTYHYLHHYQQLDMTSGCPSDFVAITVATAKCDVCNKRDKTTMRRCNLCAFQVCGPCLENLPHTGH